MYKKYFMEVIQLSNIKKGTPGISPIEGENLYENCIVALHNSKHDSPVTLNVKGLKNCDYNILWDDIYNDQLRRTYNDDQSVTERGAIAISVLLALIQTNYTIIERSRKGTGFDYMLGDAQDTLFTPKARLEISGIMNETGSNTLEKRYNQKSTQTDKTDHLKLPAYISVVEFSTPKATFNIKKQ